MSELDDYLSSTELLDCQGRVQHRLTLMIDGRVRITMRTRTVILDLATGLTDPANVALSDAVTHAAAELAGVPMPPLRHDHRPTHQHHH